MINTRLVRHANNTLALLPIDAPELVTKVTSVTVISFASSTNSTHLMDASSRANTAHSSAATSERACPRVRIPAASMHSTSPIGAVPTDKSCR